MTTNKFDLQNLEQYSIEELFDLVDEVETEDDIELTAEQERENREFLDELFDELLGEV